MSDKILIVEEHEAVRNALRNWLIVEFPNHKMCEATSGQEAIELADTDSPDLVVIDVSLSWVNGIDTTRKIKAIRRSAKIVILATHMDKIYQEVAKDAGASAYVPKGEILTELIPTVTRLLQTGGMKHS